MKLPVIHKYIDMCQVAKNNMILAPTGNLGVSRNQMPQIDNQYRNAFIAFLKSKGISVRRIRVPAKSLKMVQGEYNRDKVAAIISSGNAAGVPIFISKDGFVIDGNHRLIAQLNMPTKSSYIEVLEIDQAAIPLLATVADFPHVRYRNLNEQSK